jgi:multisubunit Na+/H+ antiporter MnhG subunit
MTPTALLALGFLATGVALTLYACFASFCVRGPLARLHYVSLVSTLAAALVTLAVLIERGASKSSVKALLVFLALVASGSVLGHATARAHHVRERRLAQNGRASDARGDTPS